jgi:hypothetical protein
MTTEHLPSRYTMGEEIANRVRGLQSNRPKMYAKENLATLTV